MNPNNPFIFNLISKGFITPGPSDGKVYLVDYGLVSSRFKNGLPKPFFPDERCACEGTLEFCSREAHLGCNA